MVGVEEEEAEAAAEARRKDEQQSDRRDGPSGPKKHSAPNATALVDLSVCVCAWVGVLGEEERTLRPAVRISGGFHSAVSVRKNSDERGAAGTEKKIAKAWTARFYARKLSPRWAAVRTADNSLRFLVKLLCSTVLKTENALSVRRLKPWTRARSHILQSPNHRNAQQEPMQEKSA